MVGSTPIRFRHRFFYTDRKSKSLDPFNTNELRLLLLIPLIRSPATRKAEKLFALTKNGQYTNKTGFYNKHCTGILTTPFRFIFSSNLFCEDAFSKQAPSSFFSQVRFPYKQGACASSGITRRKLVSSR